MVSSRIALITIIILVPLFVIGNESDNELPSSDYLAVGNYCYLSSVPDGENQKKVVAKVSKKIVKKGEETFIAIHQVMPSRNFNMKDQFVLNRDMTPTHFYHSRMGGKSLSIDYDYDGVSTSVFLLGQQTNEDGFSLKFDGKLWEGNLWGTLFTALPLQQNTTFSIPTYHYQNGPSNLEIVDVRKNDIVFNKQSIPVFEVDVNASGLMTTYFVSVEDRVELGYENSAFSQWIGGNCNDMKSLN